MKKTILFMALNVMAVFLFAQNQIRLPEELKKYSDYQQVLQNMVGDTIMFDFVRLDNETLEYTKYNPGEIKNIYTTDTIWKRKIKDKKKAKLNKHYIVTKNFKQSNEIEKGRFKVIYPKYRNNFGVSSFERNIISDYVDIYMLDLST